MTLGGFGSVWLRPYAPVPATGARLAALEYKVRMMRRALGTRRYGTETKLCRLKQRLKMRGWS